MKSKYKYLIIVFAIIIIAITIILIWHENYNENLFKELGVNFSSGYKHKDVNIIYNNESILQTKELDHFHAQFDAYFNKKSYYGKIENNADITLDIKDYGILKIYRKDKNSMFISLQKINHNPRNYLVTAKFEFEDAFNVLTKALYEDTENEIFLK